MCFVSISISALIGLKQQLYFPIKTYEHLCILSFIQVVMIPYLQHADDSFLISETPGGPQKHIDGLHKFCKQWHMTLNLMKTNICVFNRKASKRS